ncbi:MAG: 3-deoxy-D-manno-octulosonic acid transferase [PVC group bacterium]
MYYLIYNYLFFIGLLLGLPFLLFRMATARRFRAGLGERLGFYGSRRKQLFGRRSVWIQAASVGEVTAVIPLIDLLGEEFPGDAIVLTCQTAAGRAVAREKLGPRAVVLLSPLDLGCIIQELIRLISPRILILVETEIWPGMLMTARKNGVPVAVVNGRISAASFRGYRRIGPLVRPLLAMISSFGMRSAEDAARITELGAPPARVRVTGNIKFDSLPAPDLPPGMRQALERRLNRHGDEPLIIGGSTFEGEDAILYEAYRRLRPRFPGLRLILAPRHLERVPGVVSFLRSRGADCALFSRLPAGGGGGKTDVVVLDQMGVLSELYGLAALVFIGRSLRGGGGQNPIEPAALSKPILFGPQMDNFREIADNLISAGGAVLVEDENALPVQMASLLSDSARRERMGVNARRVVESCGGASTKNLELISRIIND